MNDIVEKAGKLALICAVSALLLGVVNSFTEPMISQRRAREVREALASLIATEGGIPLAEPTNTAEYAGFVGERRDLSEEGTVRAEYPVTGGAHEGSLILDLRGKGYGGEMKILASYQEDGSLIDIRLMDNTETPGLGKKAETWEYMAKFRGTGGDAPVPVSRDEVSEETDTVTGATVTFAGIANALAEGAAYVRSRGGA